MTIPSFLNARRFPRDFLEVAEYRVEQGFRRGHDNLPAFPLHACCQAPGRIAIHLLPSRFCGSLAIAHRQVVAAEVDRLLPRFIHYPGVRAGLRKQMGKWSSHL
jgi:hypothetical protein